MKSVEDFLESEILTENIPRDSLAHYDFIFEPDFSLKHEKIGTLKFNFEDYLPDLTNHPSDRVNALYKPEDASVSYRFTKHSTEEFFQKLIKQLTEIHNLVDIYGNCFTSQPGTHSRPHVDTMSGALKTFNLGTNKDIPLREELKRVIRYWIPLQDRQFGQYFEVNGNIIDWKAGDIFVIKTNTVHAFTNIGDSQCTRIYCSGLI